MESKKTARVKVGVRVRPALEREVRDGKFINCVGVQGKDIYLSQKDQAVVIREGEQLQGVEKHSFDQVFQHCPSEDVYQGLVKDSVDKVLSGFNATVFVYGQTGSGKTHTMFGDSLHPGVAVSAFQDLFRGLVRPVQVEEEGTAEHSDGEEYLSGEDSMSETQVSEVAKDQVFIQVLQIYNEQVSDMLGEGRLQVKQDRQGRFYAKGARSVEVGSAEEVRRVLKGAMKNRTQRATQLNEESSRSHLLLSLSVERVSPGGGVMASQLHLVDLAGSERVKQSGVTGDALKEASHINKSLFCLARVVGALEKGVSPKQIPYRESQLTMLLKHSLGGNCSTVLLATLSPSNMHHHESALTLRFARSCQAVTNQIHKNKYISSIPKSVSAPRALQKEKKTKEAPVWRGALAQSSCRPEYHLVDSPWDKLHYMTLGQSSWNRTVVLMHGCPSDLEEYQHLYDVFVYMECRVVSLDLPGYGKSQGKKQPSHSKNVDDKGGPADTVRWLMGHLKLKNPMVFGYDWGGAIAIRLALKGGIGKVMLLMPSYSESEKDELCRLGNDTLVIWVKQDQFHPWARFKPLMQKIKKSRLKLFDLRPYKREEVAYDAYGGIGDEYALELVKFITGVDPSQKITILAKAKQEPTIDTKGKAVTQCRQIVFGNEVTGKETEQLMKQDDPQQEAIATLKKAMSQPNEVQASRLNRTHPQHQHWNYVLGLLPPLTQHFLSEFRPQGWLYMNASPRYFPGRKHVLVMAPVKSCRPYHPDYMALSGDKSDNVFCSHRTELVSQEGQSLLLRDPSCPSTTFLAPLQDVLLCNQPHLFNKDPIGNFVFEDGLKVNYSNKSVKMKLYEILFKLEPLLAKLNFEGKEDEVVALQLECIQVVRDSLQIVTFNEGSEKKVQGDRFKVGDAGKLALYGQGNCHGVSSTMAAFLWPFCSLLGVDLKYRGGFSYSQGETEVSNSVQRHQWLELTLRPSMRSFVCDLWYEGVNNERDFLTMPMEQAYSSFIYPQPKLIIDCQSLPHSPSDIAFH